ncbi:MAG: hypothetical protein ACC669_02285 [bacterium]
MTVAKNILKFIVVAVAIPSFYVGIAGGEWAETMFNATLLGLFCIGAR